MSIARDANGTAMLSIGSPEDCFFCGEVLTFPCVIWAGGTSSIAMHPGCVVALVPRLLRDVHELEDQALTARG